MSTADKLFILTEDITLKRVSENFGPISKFQKRFWQVSNSRFRVIFMSRSLQFFFVHGSWILGFVVFLSVWSSGVDFFKVQGNTYQSELVD